MTKPKRKKCGNIIDTCIYVHVFWNHIILLSKITQWKLNTIFLVLYKLQFVEFMSKTYRNEAINLIDTRFKADMKSYIQRETAVIFVSIEPSSKTGYWLGVYHG